MKKLFLIHILLAFCSIKGNSQRIDTLKNHAPTARISAPKYTNPNQWGYYLGLNHLYRQQYGEKYHIKGKAKVVGVVAHLSGKYANPENFVEFNVYDVGRDRLPNRRLYTYPLFYRQLDLSGKAFVVKYPSPVAVQDSFYVTFNVQDYLHGGFEGDTLGLYMAEASSRPSTDLLNFGRNVVQAHNHDHEDWKDFFTQNFTPIATHFAIYPIIEREGTTASQDLTTEGATLRLAYQPNILTAFYSLPNAEKATIEIYNLLGQLQRRQDLGKNTEGVQQVVLPLEDVPSGIYIAVLKTDKGQLSEKFFVDK